MITLFTKLLGIKFIELSHFEITATGNYYTITGPSSALLCKDGVADALQIFDGNLPAKFHLVVSNVFFQGSSKVYLRKSYSSDMFYMRRSQNRRSELILMEEEFVKRLRIPMFGETVRYYAVLC